MSFKDDLLEKEKKKKGGKVLLNPPYKSIEDEDDDDDDDSIEETHAHDTFHLHKKHKPHKAPAEKPKLDIGQTKPTKFKTPSTTYKQIATSVINRGGTITRSPGQPSFKGVGKRAYKATKHSQLRLGKKRLTLPSHKGATVTGKRALKFKKLFSSCDVPDVDIMLEMKASEIHKHLLQNGFTFIEGSKHRIYHNPKTKESISVSRTGEISPGVAGKVKKVIQRANAVMSEDKKKDEIKILPPVSAKTQKVIDAGKKITKDLNKDKDKDNKDNKETLFQHSKTLTGATDKGNGTHTDVIEINPELKAPGKKDDKKDKKDKK